MMSGEHFHCVCERLRGGWWSRHGALGGVQVGPVAPSLCAAGAGTQKKGQEEEDGGNLSESLKLPTISLKYCCAAVMLGEIRAEGLPSGSIVQCKNTTPKDKWCGAVFRVHTLEFNLKQLQVHADSRRRYL